MKDYKTFEEQGQYILSLNSYVKIMRTEKETEVNKILDEIKEYSFMGVEHKNLSGGAPYAISLIRTWENERITISYWDNGYSSPFFGVDFSIDDIELTEKIKMYGDSKYRIKLKQNIEITLA